MFSIGGPVIVSIVYICLNTNGIVSTVSVPKIITEILTSALLAFIAAGISAIYNVEKIQQGAAGLIQGSVLFIDYIGIYLLNGWIPFSLQAVILFTVLFAVIFLAIWFTIYFVTKNKIKKMNKQITN